MASLFEINIHPLKDSIYFPKESVRDSYSLPDTATRWMTNVKTMELLNFYHDLGRKQSDVVRVS